MTDIAILRQQLEHVAQWLRKLSGFNPESVGWSTFNNIIKQRMRSHSIDDVTQYYQLLKYSIAEQEALIETIIIPETWFFRDPNAFHALKQIATHWRNHSKMQLRILSLPCATGEEPYSIAITLHDAGFMSHQFHIDAIDISHTAISKAMQGIYTDNSFRNKTLEFRDNYFIKMSQNYRLMEMIRNDVIFNVENFFMYSASLPYDIVFCRNLLIYFDHEIRAQAFIRLHSMLSTNGLLFLGHSEAIQATHYGWNTTPYSNIFCKPNLG